MTPPDDPADELLSSARAEIDRLRADNAHLAERLRSATEPAQFELALALAGIGLWRHDLASDLLYPDARAQATLGRSDGASGLPAAVARALVHRDDFAEVRAAYETLLAGGGPVDTRTRYRHGDGQWRTLQTRRLLVRDERGRPAEVLGVALDVTEQRRRDDDAALLARRLDTAAEAAQVGLWSSPLNGGAPQWNSRMYALLGREPARGPLRLGEALRDYVPAEDRDRVAATALDWARGRSGPGLDVEVRLRRDDGRLCWVQIRGVRDVDADGAERAFGVMLDVTPQREALERLREANERLSLALSAVAMGTWSHDTVTGREDWDETMYRLRGLQPGAAVPSHDERMALVVPDDHAAMQAKLESLLSGDAPAAYEFRIRRADDGAVRVIGSRSIALTDDAGRVTRRIGVNWDLTEMRSIERVQRERELALRESRNKSALFARISHELRTPLNAVLGFAQLMQAEEAVSTPQQRRLRLDQIRAAGQALLALVDDVLDLSQAGDAPYSALHRPLALADALEAAVATWSPAAAQRGVRIERGDLSPVVRADPRRLRQVLDQLLGNAVKFSRPQGAVRIGARASGRDAVLGIEDSGPGIDAEHARRLFEPFEGPGGAASALHGVGLALGQALAQRMGGRIELARTGPQGSLFELRLPLAQAPPAPAPAPQGATACLLYIEDNEVNMMIVRELLAQRPHVAFHGAGDGMSGVRLARERMPTLMLIDMQLPDIDGIEVLRRLRAEPLTASIPCIALSANAMPEDVASARAAGFDDYWTKPIDVPAFLREIDRLMPSPA